MPRSPPTASSPPGSASSGGGKTGCSIRITSYNVCYTKLLRYTNDQNLIDNYHKKERRGRSAPLNMVITETGPSSP